MATFLTVPVTIFPPSPVQVAYVERATSATGPWLRIGQVQLTDSAGYFYDNTAPLDVAVCTASSTCPWTRSSYPTPWSDRSP
jgi:hypothetical protein